MKRRLFIFLAGIFLVLFLTMVTLWVRSMTVRDSFAFGISQRERPDLSSEAQASDVVSERGGIRLRRTYGWQSGYSSSRNADLFPMPGWTVSSARAYPAVPDSFRRKYPFLFRHAGFVLGIERFADGLNSGHGIVLVVRIWFLAAAAGIIAIIFFRLSRRLLRRERAGRCPTCGYDLRATPGRCPECRSFGAGA